MKRRSTAGFVGQGITSGGYTLTEVMIVLAVTGALFMSVVVALSGRQAETEFNQGLRDYESKIQSVANDVSSGFYQTGTYDCEPGPGAGPVQFDSTPPFNDPGTNYGCVFLGKMITTNKLESDIFTIMGDQFNDTGGDVQTLTEAKPVAAYDPPLDITETYAHRYSIQIRNVFIIGTDTSIGGFGFISELGGGASLASPVTGSRGVLLYHLGGTIAPNENNKEANSIAIANTANLIRADAGIKICLWDGDERRGEITVGANGSQTSTFVTAGGGVSEDCKV